MCGGCDERVKNVVLSSSRRDLLTLLFQQLCDPSCRKNLSYADTCLKYKAQKSFDNPFYWKGFLNTEA